MFYSNTEYPRHSGRRVRRYRRCNRIRFSDTAQEKRADCQIILLTFLKMNRSIQVEGAFGVLKQDYGFGRFLARGKTNNETRLFILATAFNIRKLCSRLADGRFGKALFEPKTA